MLEAHQKEAAVMGAKLVHNSCVIKGKRSKRQRSSSPPLALTNSANSNSSFESPKEDGDDEEEQEEEDMANCLILLARGRGGREQTQTLNPPRTTVAASATPHNNNSKGAGLYLYECKTCSRCFPSFQALGGHRASHKKPNKVGSTSMEDDHHDPFNHTTNKDRPPPPPPPHHPTSLSLQTPNNNNKSRIHECAICGAEFASGQALGGHMRRHRPMPAAANSATCHEQDNKKPPRNLLSLDLNLPAAPEDHEPRFSFPLKEQVIVFSASPLVDCHY